MEDKLKDFLNTITQRCESLSQEVDYDPSNWDVAAHASDMEWVRDSLRHIIGGE